MNNKKSRQQHPYYSVNKLTVPDDKVNWNIPFKEYLYERPFYIHDHVRANLDKTIGRWAEPHRPKWKDKITSPIEKGTFNAFKSGTFNDRITYINGYEQTLESAGIKFDDNNLPINPIGRTGMYGPGLLGKNGPNQTADPIFTRWAPFTLLPLKIAIYNIKNLFIFDYVDNIMIHIISILWNIFKEIILLFPHLQMIAIQRRDTEEWAIPGGMVEDGETVSDTLRNEINQEACNNMDSNNFSVEIDKILDKNNGVIIYRGYVDDPRNTDSRWIETTAVHYHCDCNLAKEIKLNSGDDAKNVMWLDMTNLVPKYRNLYANHKMMTDRAIIKFYTNYIMNNIIILISITLFIFIYLYK